MATMTDAGINALIEAISHYVRTGSTNSLTEMCSDCYSSGLKYSCIKTDANGRNYIYMHRTQNQGYAKGGFGLNAYYDNVYISEAQMKRIYDEVESSLIKDAKTLEECILDNNENNFCYNDYRYYNICKAYLENNKEKWNTRAEEALRSDANLTDKKAIIKRDIAYRARTIKSLKPIETILNKIYKRFCEECTQHATNDAFVIWQYENEGRVNKTAYISKTSVEEFAAKIAQIGQEIIKLKAESAALKEEMKKVILEELKAKLLPALDYMKQRQKPDDIAYGGSAQYFYTTSSNEYWRGEFKDRLKPFCPIVDVEMVEINNTDILINIKKLGKKKVVTTYQISVTHKDGKLCVESFDITKAKQL